MSEPELAREEPPCNDSSHTTPSIGVPSTPTVPADDTNKHSLQQARRRYRSPSTEEEEELEEPLRVRAESVAASDTKYQPSGTKKGPSSGNYQESSAQLDAAIELQPFYRSNPELYAVPDTPCSRCEGAGLECFLDRSVRGKSCIHCRNFKIACPAVFVKAQVSRTELQEDKTPQADVAQPPIKRRRGRPPKANKQSAHPTQTLPTVIPDQESKLGERTTEPGVAFSRVSTPTTSTGTESTPVSNTKIGSATAVKPILVWPKYPISFNILEEDPLLAMIVTLSCGGDIDPVETAMFLVSSAQPGSAVRAPATRTAYSRLVSSKWVWACAEAGRLLNPSDYALRAIDGVKRSPS